jgi:hypothetical protein
LDCPKYDLCGDGTGGDLEEDVKVGHLPFVLVVVVSREVAKKSFMDSVGRWVSIQSFLSVVGLVMNVHPSRLGISTQMQQPMAMTKATSAAPPQKPRLPPPFADAAPKNEAETDAAARSRPVLDRSSSSEAA